MLCNIYFVHISWYIHNECCFWASNKYNFLADNPIQSIIKKKVVTPCIVCSVLCINFVLPSQAYIDESTKQVYYGNSLTSETSWDRPGKWLYRLKTAKFCFVDIPLPNYVTWYISDITTEWKCLSCSAKKFLAIMVENVLLLFFIRRS
jgi:hypothetical protein